MNKQFIYSYKTFQSFATFEDVVARDSRVFEANELLTADKITDYLVQSSQRILSQIKNTDWWSQYQRKQALITDPRLIPSVDPEYIIGSTQEFRDLNVYFALLEYIYPSIADFGNPDSAEVQKIKHFKDSYNLLFQEVIQSGDWYDFTENGVIDLADKMPVTVNRARTR